MGLQGRVSVQEDHSLCFQVLTNLVINNFGFVLSSHTGYQPLPLGIRNAKSLVCVPDVLWKVFPALGLLLSGADKVLDVVKVNAAEV